MILAFKKEIDKENPISSIVSDYKERMSMKFYTIDELREKLKGKKFTISVKLDGEIVGIEYKDGRTITVTRAGTIRYDLPVTDEITELLKNKPLKEFIGVGEIYGVSEDGIPLSYLKSQSLLKAPKTKEDEERIRIIVFDIISIDGIDWQDKDLSYRISGLRNLFSKGKYVKPAEYFENADLNDVDELWDKVVQPQKYGYEGLIIYYDNKIVKVKPILSIDLVVVAVERSKKHPEQMGAILTSFRDKEGIFRLNGKVGTGFTDKERLEFIEWAERNKVFEDEDGRIWVDPFKEPCIVEVQGEEVNIKKGPAYKFEDNKWIQIEDKMTGIIRKPRIERYREDKKVIPEDLRLEQIPGFEEKGWLMSRIANIFQYGNNNKLEQLRAFLNKEAIFLTDLRKVYIDASKGIYDDDKLDKILEELIYHLNKLKTGGTTRVEVEPIKRNIKKIEELIKQGEEAYSKEGFEKFYVIDKIVDWIHFDGLRMQWSPSLAQESELFKIWELREQMKLGEYFHKEAQIGKPISELEEDFKDILNMKATGETIDLIIWNLWELVREINWSIKYSPSGDEIKMLYELKKEVLQKIKDMKPRLIHKGVMKKIEELEKKAIKYLYHSTNVPPEIILKEGLVGRKTKGLTEAGEQFFDYGWLPEESVFVSKEPGKFPGKYIYKVDVSGLDLLPDYAMLVDLGAYVDDVEGKFLYWKHDEQIPRGLKSRHDPEWGVYYKDITGEDTLRIAGTAVVVGPISPDRIVLYSEGKECFHKEAQIGKQRSEKGNLVYIAIDGDDIGDRVEEAIYDKDTEVAKNISNQIKNANKEIIEIITKYNGEVIFEGGDNIFISIPITIEEAKKLGQQFIDIYLKNTGHTATVGIGKIPTDAHKSLVLGKNTGKNKIVIWDDSYEPYWNKMIEYLDVLEKKIKDVKEQYPELDEFLKKESEYVNLVRKQCYSSLFKRHGIEEGEITTFDQLKIRDEFVFLRNPEKIYKIIDKYYNVVETLDENLRKKKFDENIYKNEKVIRLKAFQSRKGVYEKGTKIEAINFDNTGTIIDIAPEERGGTIYDVDYVVKWDKPLEDGSIISEVHPTEIRKIESEIDENKDLQKEVEELKKRLYTDALTGLYSRHWLEDNEERLLEENNYIILTDIDHFKQINDEYGHDKGDEVLKTVADLIKSLDIENIVRWGGEEFVIFIELDDEEDLKELLELIRNTVEEETKQTEIPVTISLGAAPLESNIDDSFTKADKALYESKNKGRNRWTIYTNEFEQNACYHEGKSMKIESSLIYAYKPKHPETIIVEPNEFYKEGLNEGEIFLYYDTVKDDIIETYLKYDLDVTLFKKVDDTIVQRKIEGKPINIKDFDKLNNGRNVEWHFSLKDTTPFLYVDLDPKEGFSWDDLKDIVFEVKDLIETMDNVVDTKIVFSGSKGFHVYGILKKEIDVDEARTAIKLALEEYIENKNDKRLTTGVTKKENTCRLDTSTLHRAGGLRVPYSLSGKTGLVCLPIDEDKLFDFEKEDAKIDKVLKKLYKKSSIEDLDEKVIRYKETKDEKIFNEIYPELKRLAYPFENKLGKAGFYDASSIIDEIILHSIDTYDREKGKFSTWLYNQLDGRVKDEIRDLYLQKEIVNTIAYSLEDVIYEDKDVPIKIKNIIESKYDSPEEKVIVNDLFDKILNLLTDVGKKVFNLLVSGYSQVEIAEILGISPPRVTAIIKDIQNKTTKFLKTASWKLESSVKIFNKFTYLQEVEDEYFLKKAQEDDRLEEYKKKRDFDITPEPKPKIREEGKSGIQLHYAKKAGKHFDWRIFKDGVLKSGVTRKIPEPGQKVLFIETEDHPVDYIYFEGEIPKGEYGAGIVETYAIGDAEILEWSDKKRKFRLNTDKVKGEFTLIPMEDRKWLMIRSKEEDKFQLKTRLDYGIEKEAGIKETLKMIIDFIAPFSWLFIKNPKLKAAFNLLKEYFNEVKASKINDNSKKIIEMELNAYLEEKDKTIEELDLKEIFEAASYLRKILNY